MGDGLVFHRQYWGLLRCITTSAHTAAKGASDGSLQRARALCAKCFAEAVIACPNSDVLVHLAQEVRAAREATQLVETALIPCTTLSHAAVEKR